MESNNNKNTETIKFLCSYGRKILPHYTNGTLRYAGGLTRVLAVDCSISFTELMVKLGKFCGLSVNLRCQFPIGNLETLILITSNDRLRHDGRRSYLQRRPAVDSQSFLLRPFVRLQVLKKDMDVYQLQWYGYCLFRALACLHKQDLQSKYAIGSKPKRELSVLFLTLLLWMNLTTKYWLRAKLGLERQF